MQREFEVEIEDAAPGAPLDVMVDGVLVGQITTDGSGRAELDLSSHPDDADELPLPADFPELSAGSTVTIVDRATGTTIAEATLELVPGDTGGGDGNGGGEDGNGGGDDDNDNDPNATSLFVQLDGAIDVEAQFTSHAEDAGVEREFELDLEDAVPGTVLDIRLNDILIGQITIGADPAAPDRGELNFDDTPDRPGEQAFPADFPALVAGATLQVIDAGTGDVVAEGVFQVGEPPPGGPGDDNPDGGNGGNDDSETFLAAQSDGAVDVKAKFKSRPDSGGVEREFEVEVDEAAAGAQFNVLVGGVLVGQVTIGTGGDEPDEGKLAFNTTPDEPHEQPFPADFPVVAAGTLVTIVDVTTGTTIGELELQPA